MAELVVHGQELAIGYGRQTVVGTINLELQAGQTLCLVGVNGSGKSTLLKTLAGLLPPIAGSLSVFGQGPGKTPARLAYLAQNPGSALLLPLRVVDVVRMARFTRRGLLGRLGAADKQAVDEAIEQMGVGHLADESLNRLSGGQKQRVFLAYVLARQADLALLDEPASHLDPSGLELYQAAIARLRAGGTTIVTATHNIKEAAEADLAMLLAGRVVAQGHGAEVLTPESLLATFGLIAKLEEGRVVVVEKEHGHEH